MCLSLLLRLVELKPCLDSFSSTSTCFLFDCKSNKLRRLWNHLSFQLNKTSSLYKYMILQRICNWKTFRKSIFAVTNWILTFTFVFRSIKVKTKVFFIFPCLYTKLLELFKYQIKSRKFFKNVFHTFNGCLNKRNYYCYFLLFFFGRSKYAQNK